MGTYAHKFATYPAGNFSASDWDDNWQRAGLSTNIMCVATGTGNAIILTTASTAPLAASLTTLQNGMVFWFKATASNGAATTITVDSTSTLTVYDSSGLALTNGIVSGSVYAAAYDSTISGYRIMVGHVSGAPLYITSPPGTLTEGITINQNAGGTSASAYNPLNEILVLTDSADVGANFGEAFLMRHFYGGPTMKGGRCSLQVASELGATSAATNTNRNYVAIVGSIVAGANDNGTNTGAGARGAFFGANFTATTLAGATNLLELTGGEVDIALAAGCSAAIKVGWSICQVASDAVVGATYDAALGISNAPATVGWTNGILFSDSNGAFPMQATGTLIKTQGTQTIDKGVDISSATVTTAAFKSPGYTLDGTGVFVSSKSLNGNAFNSVVNTNSGGNATARWNCTNNSGQLIDFGITSNAFTAYGALGSSTGFFYTVAPTVLMADSAAFGVISVAAGGNAETARFTTSGGFSVGTTSNGGAGSILATAQITAGSNTTPAAGGTTGVGLLLSSKANFGIFFGSGAPSVTAATGSWYMRTDGNAVNNRLYVNTTGGAVWTAVTTTG